jgi:hypothetical protein
LLPRTEVAPESAAAHPAGGCDDGRVPWAPFPVPPHDPALDLVAATLDPVLVPMGFAAGQIGASATQGQVIFCRGLTDSVDGGCVDLVLDLEATPGWRITDVRYGGFPSDRWHLTVPNDPHLEGQLATLVRTLAEELE